MIHPVITKIFPDDNELKLIFSLIGSKTNQINELDEFIKWHLDLSEQIIKEIVFVQNIDFSKENDVKKWAKDYLDSYEEKIRKMRHISNLVFTRFHKLKEGELKRISSENKDYAKKITSMMEIFLNKKELLVGKMIFAYRETWFLANQMHYPNFKIGSVQQYKNWEQKNLPNLKKINQSLEEIHNEISKWKE